MTRTAVFVVLLALGLMVAPAFAVVTIDFGTGVAGAGGTYTLLAGGNATGTNIPISRVTITGAGANNGVFVVTGTCTDTTGGTNFGCLNFNTVTNTISITGAISSLGIPLETLLSGSFTSFTAGPNGLTNAVGPDTKAANLLTAISVPVGTAFNLFGFSLTTTGAVTVGGSDTAVSTDIRNTSVPEPSSIMLFGTALFGTCAALRRRRLSKKS